MRALEGYLGITFTGLVSIEYGGGNTGDYMASAAHMGRCIVDADAAGRAVPELQFSTYYVTDKPIAPFSVTTTFGDEVIVKRVADDARAEALSRFMAVGSEGTVGMADHPIHGKELKTSVVPNALSYAGSVGRARREAEAVGKNPIDALLGAAGGKVLFEGIVNAKGGWEIKDGFTFGDIYIDGKNDKECRIWYKNENMLCWIGGEVALTCPDIICVVDTATGYPITNPNCTEGRAVTVLGFLRHELWKTEKALSILNPRIFGFQEECVFLEQ